MQIETQQPVEGEIAFPHASVLVLKTATLMESCDARPAPNKIQFDG